MTANELIQYNLVLQAAKNKDYGNSFDQTVDKFGIVVACIRMHDKINRLNSLSKADANVNDESMFDTWLDLVNYALMSASYLVINCKQYDKGNTTAEVFRHILQTTMHDCKPAGFFLEHDIKLVENMNDALHTAANADMQIKTCIDIATVAFSRCLTYSTTYFNPKYATGQN